MVDGVMVELLITGGSEVDGGGGEVVNAPDLGAALGGELGDSEPTGEGARDGVMFGVERLGEGEEAGLGFGNGLVPDGIVLGGGPTGPETGSFQTEEGLASGLGGGEEGFHRDSGGGVGVRGPQM